MGRIIGNLDCECDWARAVSQGSDARQALPSKVTQVLSALATLLRGAARDGDTLWTPLPVRSERMAPVSGLPEPRLESGSLENLREPGESVLVWGETAATTALRARGAPGAVACVTPSFRPETLWKLPVADRASAAAVNHRGLCHRLRQELDETLPFEAEVSSRAELEATLRAMAKSWSGRWVLKAPHSAAGRDRLFGHCVAPGDGSSTATNPTAATVERFLAVHGPSLLESWVERLDDFGCCGVVSDAGVTILAVHRQEVDGAGRYRATITPGGGFPHAPRHLPPSEVDRLRTRAHAAGERLGAAGYRGPFGVDSWRYRDAGGLERWQPLGEINARWTFGWIAWTLTERLREPLGIRDDAQLRLMVTGSDWKEPPARGVRRVPLLFPGEEGEGGEGGGAADLEIVPSPR